MKKCFELRIFTLIERFKTNFELQVQFQQREQNESLLFLKPFALYIETSSNITIAKIKRYSENILS